MACWFCTTGPLHLLAAGRLEDVAGVLTAENGPSLDPLPGGKEHSRTLYSLFLSNWMKTDEGLTTD